MKNGDLPQRRVRIFDGADLGRWVLVPAELGTVGEFIKEVARRLDFGSTNFELEMQSAVLPRSEDIALIRDDDCLYVHRGDMVAAAGLDRKRERPDDSDGVDDGADEEDATDAKQSSESSESSSSSESSEEGSSRSASEEPVSGAPAPLEVAPEPPAHSPPVAAPMTLSKAQRRRLRRKLIAQRKSIENDEDDERKKPLPAASAAASPSVPADKPHSAPPPSPAQVTPKKLLPAASAAASPSVPADTVHSAPASSPTGITPSAGESGGADDSLAVGANPVTADGNEGQDRRLTTTAESESGKAAASGWVARGTVSAVLRTLRRNRTMEAKAAEEPLTHQSTLVTVPQHKRGRRRSGDPSTGVRTVFEDGEVDDGEPKDGGSATEVELGGYVALPQLGRDVEPGDRLALQMLVMSNGAPEVTPWFNARAINYDVDPRCLVVETVHGYETIDLALAADVRVHPAKQPMPGDAGRP